MLVVRRSIFVIADIADRRSLGANYVAMEAKAISVSNLPAMIPTLRQPKSGVGDDGGFFGCPHSTAGGLAMSQEIKFIGGRRGRSEDAPGAFRGR
jgi:hypothetical protein